MCLFIRTKQPVCVYMCLFVSAELFFQSHGHEYFVLVVVAGVAFDLSLLFKRTKHSGCPVDHSRKRFERSLEGTNV